MALARELASWLARENARPLAGFWYQRVVAMVLATIAGWLAGWVLGGAALGLLLEERAAGIDSPPPGPLESALFASTLGCVLAFPSLLLWLALLLRSSSPLVRLEVAPVFGALCGLTVAAVVLTRIVHQPLLRFNRLTAALCLLAAAAGATTWTTYVLLARRVAAPTTPQRGAG